MQIKIEVTEFIPPNCQKQVGGAKVLDLVEYQMLASGDAALLKDLILTLVNSCNDQVRAAINSNV